MEEKIKDIQIVQKDDLGKIRLFQNAKSPCRWFTIDSKYISESGLFFREILTIPQDGVDYYKRRIFAASQSSLSATPIEFWIYDGDKFVGWAEKYIMDLNNLKGCNLETCLQVLKLHCLHQYDLLKMGYLELDFNPVNWAIVKGDIKTFDKDSVHGLEEARYAFVKNGVYFRMARNGGMGKVLLSIQDSIVENYDDPDFWLGVSKKYE